MSRSKIHQRVVSARKRKQGIYQSRDIDVRRISSALIKALASEKPEEKQFWAEAAFRLLCTDEYVDHAKATFKWHGGVPPSDIEPPAWAVTASPETVEVQNGGTVVSLHKGGTVVSLHKDGSVDIATHRHDTLAPIAGGEHEEETHS